MSNVYDPADLSMAYNDGHNDGWSNVPPRPPHNTKLRDEKHQRYREGHAAGMTARYWFDKGYEQGKN